MARLNSSNNSGKFGVEGDGWVLGMIGRHGIGRAGWHYGWAEGGSALRRVKYFRHLAMVEAVGFTTEGGMGTLMLERLSSAFVALTAFLVSG
jgi:hypothetical protein